MEPRTVFSESEAAIFWLTCSLLSEDSQKLCVGAAWEGQHFKRGKCTNVQFSFNSSNCELSVIILEDTMQNQLGI